MRDQYEILDVPPSATPDEINKSFRRLAKALHPDLHDSDPEFVERFAELNEAHKILGDKDRRKAFDRGDIDGSGRTSLVVGTRALGSRGRDTTHLFAYRFDAAAQAWQRETLDTSGPLGFHCVLIADVDGDGRAEVIASDDGRGLIKLYRKREGEWRRQVIHAAKGPIFCSAISAIDVAA